MAGIALLASLAIASATPVRNSSGDLWADVIIGQPEFGEVSQDATVGNHLDTMGGVVIDTASIPQRLYIYDARHHRVLGFDWDAVRTNPEVNPQPSIVLGEPNATTSLGNGDSNFQNYPQLALPNANSLLGLHEDQVSVNEGGSASNMAVGADGSLYVFDAFNSRVLRYVDPFNSPTTADVVWGQPDFNSRNCGATSSAFCFHWNGNNVANAGVAIDGVGNLWVADMGNNRVLRFAPGSSTANLVLGQSSFTSSSSGTGLNQMWAPSAVRVNAAGQVYVADENNGRILRFTNPTTGMSGELFASGFGLGPTSLEWDPTEPGRIWVGNTDTSMTIELWSETTKTKIRQVGRPGDGNFLGAGGGRRVRGFGVDAGGNIFVVPGYGELAMQGLYFAKGGDPTQTTRRYFTGNSQITAADLGGAVSGVAITSGNQMVVADYRRILYWNNPDTLATHQAADGWLGGITEIPMTGFQSMDPSCCTALAADANGHIWAATHQDRDFSPGVLGWTGPLTPGKTPSAVIRGGAPFAGAPTIIPVLGGGSVNVGIIWGVVPTTNSEFLWISDSDRSRVLRIRDPLTNPVVDVILGQTNSTGVACNRGGAMASSTLCYPGGLAIDKQGNLWVSDHSLEIRGNNRLMRYAPFVTDNTQPIYATAAAQIITNVATWQPAFSSTNQMVVGYNAYHSANPGGGRFPGVYANPLSQSTPNDLLEDYSSMSYSAAFDAADNLYVADLNRGRVLIYKSPFGPAAPTPTAVPSTPTPIPPTPTAVPPTATAVPPTATAVPGTPAPIPPTPTCRPRGNSGNCR